MKLLEFNQTALSYVFNLNTGLNGCRYRIETAELYNTNPIEVYLNLTDWLAGVAQIINATDADLFELGYFLFDDCLGWCWYGTENTQ